jgi:glycerate-2-kinase
MGDGHHAVGAGLAFADNPSQYLDTNDSYTYFESLDDPIDDPIKTGPTDANVMDV